MTNLSALVGTVLAAFAAPMPNSAHAAPALPAGASAYEAIIPTRVLDTRPTGDALGGQVVTVDLPAELAGASAVAVNLTAVNPTAPGWLTAYSGVGPIPDTSSVNFDAGEVAANLAVARVVDGSFGVYASATADVLVDVLGTFTSENGPVSAGRWVPVASQRIVDTRGRGFPVMVDESLTVTLPVPPGATAASLTITAVDALAPGYLSVAPEGAASRTSTVNYGGASGATRANSTLVAVRDGAVTIVVRDAAAHVLVDITGYFTGEAAIATTEGLFVVAGPQRVLDTRNSTGDNLYGNTAPAVGDSVESGTLGDVAGAIVNVTSTGTAAAGHLTAWPAGTARPEVSLANARGRGDTIAGAAAVPTSTRGVAAHTSGGGSVIVDLLGTFTGTPRPAPLPPPTPRPTAKAAVGATPVVRIVIPKLRLDVRVEDVADTLDPAIATPFHYGLTALPGDGDGIVAIGGDRNSKLAPFYGLTALVEDDTFELVTADGTRWLYRVTRNEGPQPNSVELADRILDQSGGPGAVLFTCSRANGTPGGTTHRIVVHADLVGAITA